MTEEKRIARNEYMRAWKKTPKAEAYYTKYNGERRFGGKREQAIQRDGEMCVMCKMSRKEHKIKYKRDITVDHIDGKGRYASVGESNHDLDNLQTLCLACHGRKDGLRGNKNRIVKGYSFCNYYKYWVVRIKNKPSARYKTEEEARIHANIMLMEE